MIEEGAPVVTMTDVLAVRKGGVESGVLLEAEIIEIEVGRVEIEAEQVGREVLSEITEVEVEQAGIEVEQVEKEVGKEITVTEVDQVGIEVDEKEVLRERDHGPSAMAIDAETVKSARLTGEMQVIVAAGGALLMGAHKTLIDGKNFSLVASRKENKALPTTLIAKSRISSNLVAPTGRNGLEV